MRIAGLCALIVACCAASARSQMVPEHSGAVSSEQMAEHLHLQDLIREAQAKSPELKGIRHRVDALRHRVPQVTALSDPAVSVGWAGRAEPFTLMRSDPSSARTFAVSEQIPYPGRRRLQGELAGQDVAAAETEYSATQRRITAEARTAYYEYLFATRAIEAATQSRSVLQDLVKSAEEQYRVGKTMQTDLLRAQLQLSLQLQKIITYERQVNEASARINTLLQRSPESRLPAPDDLEALPLPTDLGALYETAASNDASGQSAQIDAERGRIAKKLAEKLAHPDLNVGYMLQQRSGLDTMQGLTFSINLPLFSKNRQREAISEADSMQASAESSHRARMNQVRLEVRQQWIAAQTAQQMITLYNSGILPQAQISLESSIAAYRNGKADLQTVLTNITALIEIRIDYARQVADEQNAIARIDAITGSSTPESSTAAATEKEGQ